MTTKYKYRRHSDTKFMLDDDCEDAKCIQSTLHWSNTNELQSKTCPNDKDKFPVSDDGFDSDEDIEDIEDIPLLLDEVRKIYNVHALKYIKSTPDGTNNTEPEARAAFEKATNRLINVTRTKSCSTCSVANRVENAFSFKRGQHISMPGQFLQSYSKHTHKLKHAYRHHAIIKEVKLISEKDGKMVLIHFSKENGTVKICQTEKKFDLKNDEIYIIRYLHPRYEPEEIARRAETIENGDQHEFENYNLLLRNCEHFATWCVVGEGKSLQVQGLIDRIPIGLRILFCTESRIAKVIMRLLCKQADKFADSLIKAVNEPEFILGGSAAIYLIYCIVMTALHVRDYRNGQMCWSCLKGKLQNLWLVGVFDVTSAIKSVIFKFALPSLEPGVGIPLTIMLILLSALLKWSVSKILKALQNPFQVDKSDVKSLSYIYPGDVISLRYYGLEHVMIASDIFQEKDSTRGCIRGIHYGLPHLFGTREIMEEFFTVDLKTESVKLYDCRHLLCHSPEYVVMRARIRIGETKWALASNRSDHFCFWAKLQQAPSGACEEWNYGSLSKSESKKLSSLFIEEKEIHLLNEMKVGDVIQHKRTGILVGIAQLSNQNGRHCQIEMAVYDSGWYCRYEKYQVDLNKDRLYVKRYHPAYCHPMAVRAERAKELKDKKGKWWTDKGFIEHCILLNS